MIPRVIVRIAIAVALVATAAPAAPPGCALSAADKAAIEGMLGAWLTARVDILRDKSGSLPWVVFYDETCVWHFNEDPAGFAAQITGRDIADARVVYGGRPTSLRGLAHGGKVRLPDGAEIPPQIASFAATYGDRNRPFFVMAMPSIWRAAPHLASEANLDVLIRAVFVHEMTHTLQTPTLGPRIDRIAKRAGLGDDFDDDIVQKRFAERPGFREAYERERDLLYRAAAEPDRRRRVALAAEALAAMRERRAKFFTGPDAFYAELEDHFLMMEGVSQWAGYKVALRERLAGVDALGLMRRGGKQWSQDEGLAIFLALDALGVDWTSRALGPDPPLVVDLLAEAAR